MHRPATLLRASTAMKAFSSRIKRIVGGIARGRSLRNAQADSSTDAAPVLAEAGPSVSAVAMAQLEEYPANHKVHYLTTEAAVNQALAFIHSGAIGFDTEYAPPKKTDVEKFLDKLFANVPGNKQSVLMALHALELQSGGQYKIDWEHSSLCIVQIARADQVWLINMNRIKAFPAELRRILLDPDIAKVGFGLVSDIPVIWYDLGIDINNLVDCGLMARLTFTDEKYADGAFSFLALKTAVQDVLGLKISKDMQKSDWRGDVNGDLTAEQKKYAAIDAHASLRVYEELVPLLAAKAQRLQLIIPSAWYTFNGRFGHPVRTQITRSGTYAPWSPALPTWFFGGKFQGYQF